MSAIEGFTARYGPWALVAGGSEGLGAAFAQELASLGLNLLLVARRSGPLDETAGRLRASYGVEVKTASMDLSAESALSELQRAAEGLDIGLLVCDATLSHTGPFLEAELSHYQKMVSLNCRTNLGMIHWQAGRMAARGRGGILVMSSMTGAQGSPMVAVYGATKAFLINLAEALWDELKPLGVDVLACCAGPIRTPNYLATKPQGAGPAPLEKDPGEVAHTALKALGRKPLVVPGFTAGLARQLMVRAMPLKAAVGMMGRNTRALFKD